MSTFTPEDRRQLLRWIGINALIGVLVPSFYAFESYWSLEGLSKIWDDMLYSFLMSMGISGAVGINERILDKRFPWLEQPIKRFFAEFIGVSFFGFSAAFIMSTLFFTLFGMIDYHDFPWKTLAETSLIPLYIGYGITAFFISRGFLNRARAEAVRAEKLQTEKYRSEVRMLKDQLNPHFLFNALNVLTNMVYEDADKSASYIRQLSRFYRYVLEVQDEDLVSLDRELKFCADYLKLQQERFGENALKYRISLQGIEQHKLPPLALQLLMENALKHNRLSEEEPLEIVIEEKEGQLSVQNNVQIRSTPSDHLGIGLSNLVRRYELLKSAAPEIKNNSGVFIVNLPLFKA